MAVNCSAGAVGLDVGGVSGEGVEEAGEAAVADVFDAGGTPEVAAGVALEVVVEAEGLVSLLVWSFATSLLGKVAWASLESFSKSARFLESSRAFWACSCWISFSATWSAKLEPKAPLDNINLSGEALPFF